MKDTIFTGLPRGGDAVFVFGSIAMRRGGVTRALLTRMRLYAEAGIKVRLLLTRHSFREDEEKADIWQAWKLPDTVEVRYFWREAAPDGGGAPADPLAHAGQEPGLTAFTEEVAAGSLVRFYHDGLLVKTKQFGSQGRLQRIDHHDAARRVVSRENFDVHGRLVFIDEMNPDTGKPTLRRWFDRSGACWLTCWLNAQGDPAETVRHKPSPVAYDNFGQCVALWVDEVLAESKAPVIFSDKRNQDQVLLASTHPAARKVAVLHNCHTTKPYSADDSPKSNWLPLLQNIDAFDAVVALTQKQCSDIERHYGGGLTVINHPAPASPRLDLPRQPGLLVAIARLEGQKRLDHAIRAFALATSQVPNARFDIYGTGSQASSLKSLVRQLRIADRVTFRGFTDRPLEVFASASATVLSSLYEGFPLVLNEAMGVGTPFVAYDINYGPAEVIRDEVDGLLVPAGDIDTFATALARVLGDPHYAAKLGERAREVTERFSPERWTAEWMQLYSTLVDRSQAPPDAGHADLFGVRLTPGEA